MTETMCHIFLGTKEHEVELLERSRRKRAKVTDSTSGGVGFYMHFPCGVLQQG
jgi:hypothetical protein